MSAKWMFKKSIRHFGAVANPFVMTFQLHGRLFVRGSGVFEPCTVV